MQAATLLQVSRRTIYNRIRDGQLATIRIHGSQRVLTSSLVGKEGARLAAHAPDTAQSAQF
jgi:excisionase family DNA binding protein